ncbi:hypothetical protein [uncultured Planktosalinus sp.]|uniref:hypothetical protein n=1 Tax=uncultured Planktosalinus sp. TaxID=1810935 RepID=UPI0030DC219A
MEHISGYFNDDGTPLNPDLIPTTRLCLSCVKHEDKNEEILCNLTSLDKADEKEFVYFGFQNTYAK